MITLYYSCVAETTASNKFDAVADSHAENIQEISMADEGTCMYVLLKICCIHIALHEH